MTAASLASVPRAKKAANGTPTPLKAERREPPVQPRSPSPPAERSPPRKIKRPGTVRTAADKEALRKQQVAREAEDRQALRDQAAARGVHDVVRQHYNAVPERGREWRKTASKIPGLRSLNNWIKSTVIQKFSPAENGRREQGLLVLDIGCGKGGDLNKWHAAPQAVELYVGFDGADVSIYQARERYASLQKGGLRGRERRPVFQGEFAVKDCFTSPVTEAPIVRQVQMQAGGFDIVSMMFCMHYAFETEQKARNMIRNVAGSLKKGGRFIGTIPSSEVINAKLAEYHARRGVQPVAQEEESSDDEWDPEKPSEQTAATPAKESPAAQEDTPEDLEWGNDIYHVKIPRAGTFPTDGIYRPPYGWRYTYFLEEAVEAPEFVVPWAAFRALASEHGLELQWDKQFNKVWDEEKSDRVLGPLSERMNVVDRETGKLKVTEQEMEAASFYRAFCLYKT